MPRVAWITGTFFPTVKSSALCSGPGIYLGGSVSGDDDWYLHCVNQGPRGETEPTLAVFKESFNTQHCFSRTGGLSEPG